MKRDILVQLVHANFLSDEASTAILAGCPPPISEVVMALLFVSIDAAAVGLGKPEISSRCLRRQGLANSFLTALLFSDSTGARLAVTVAKAEMAFLA